MGELNCQKGPVTIRLRYPVHGTVLAGTGTRLSGTSLFFCCIERPRIQHWIECMQFFYKMYIDGPL